MSADWITQVKNDILKLHAMRPDAPVGMGTWLDRQMRGNRDPLETRLVLTEALLTSIMQLMKTTACTSKGDGTVFKDPLEGTPLYPVEAAENMQETLQARGKVELLHRLQHQIQNLEKNLVLKSAALEDGLRKQREVETELEEERKVSTRRVQDIGKLRKELNDMSEEQRRTSDKVARLSLSLAEETRNVHVLTSRLNNAQEASVDADALPSSGLHRLFSGTASRKALGTSRSTESAAPNMEDKRASLITEREVRLLINEQYPTLCSRDVEKLATEIALDLNDNLKMLHEYRGVLDGTEKRIRKLSDTMAEGVNLAVETQDRTNKLSQKCKQLEQQLEERDKRIDMVEASLGRRASEGRQLLQMTSDLNSANDAKLRLQHIVDTKDCEDIDSFLSDELRSMRDAFTIKLRLANEEVEAMQRRHIEQINEIKRVTDMEKVVLYKRIHSLESGTA